MKKIISFILILSLSFNIISLTSASDTSYENWKQWDSEWKDVLLGNRSETSMGNIGCLVTSIAIVASKLGLANSNFTPGVFAKELKNVGALNENGALYWEKTEKAISGLDMVGKVSLKGKSQSEKASIISQYTINGYACTICVKSGGHYVAANYVSGDTVYIHDPGYNNRTILFDSYKNSGVTSIRVFKNTAIESNDDAKTSKSNSSDVPTNVKTIPSIDITQYPTTIEQGKSFGLRGTISSESNITSVKGYIINSNGVEVMSTTDYPNSKSMDIRPANINQKMAFGNLSTGNYTLRVIATDSTDGTDEWEEQFTVESPTGGNTGISNPDKNIKKGQSGEAVKELQRSLNTIMNAGLKVDGIFGDGTLKAVKNFQSKYGLTVDGIAGPKTNAKINSLIK